MVRLEYFQPKWVLDGACRIWIGARTTSGYGHFWNGQKAVGDHRYAYEQKHGPLPPGIDVHHKCGRPACVNPDHMELMPHGVHA
jgi:hypothetical protein